jgi:hypothetical protein
MREEPARIPIIPLAIGTKIASNAVEHDGGCKEHALHVE